MKIANSYEHCKLPRRNCRLKHENCKLIWKLQTDMKIANWYENCKLIWELQSNSHILLYSSYVDVCNFHMRHSGNENLFWNRKNVTVRLRWGCGWRKSNKTTSHKTFHDSYFNTNSHAETVWFIFTLAARGLEELFFQSCCCVSFLVVAGNSFRCYLPTIPVVPTLCLFFWLRREIVLGCTDQFFGYGGK